MEWVDMLVYLKSHKTEDSDVILLVFQDARQLNYWKRANGIGPEVRRVENYEWAVATSWLSIVGRRYRDFKIM